MNTNFSQNKKFVAAIAVTAIFVLLSANAFQGILNFRGNIVNASFAPNPRTPIQHIIIIIQENHAFDNMFGTFPGLPSGYSENLSACMPFSPKQTTIAPCVKPYYEGSNASTIQGIDMPHTRGAALRAYNNASMNGFVENAANDCKTCSMAYVNGSIIPYYWDYAQYYTLNYQFMSSALSFSLPNHLYAVAAQAGYSAACLDLCDTRYNLTFSQIGEYLTAAGISWGYFQQDWNDSNNCPKSATMDSHIYNRPYLDANTRDGYDGYWSGLVDFTQVQMTPVECSSLGNLNDFQNAVNNNSLPSVSWVVPLANNSDHPGQSTWQAGQHYVNSMIRLVEESPEWSSTVMLLLWDDWGAYYDHVTPIQYDQWGEGFRVPLIAISPYSIHGGIVEAPAFNYGTNPAFQGVHQEDLSALLSTIEYNWGLGNLTDRDGYEPNLFYMLNFTQKPLAPLILGDSGVSYPLPPLVMEQSPQTIGQPMASVNALVIPLLRSIGTTTLTIWTAQTSPYHESTAEALSMSGDGDPGD